MDFKKQMKTNIWTIVAFIITYGLFFLKFPFYILAPNNQTFIPNGDPLVTLYDMMFHVRYDDSTIFSGMNYPKGEYIFMTDALGSFATIFRWIDTYLIDIDQITPGIVFTITFLLFGVCGAMVFKLLKEFNISTLFAIILSPLITFLSPQMARTVCHFGLAFPFVLPMVMLWLIHKYKHQKLDVWDAIFAIITFFFFMNNAYVGFIMCMFAGIVGFVLFIKSRKTKSFRKGAILMMALPTLLTILVFVILKTNDPYNDRLQEQWGFFYYHTKWDSFFFPRYSLIASWMEEFSKKDKRSIEWAINLGIVPNLLMVSWAIYGIIQKFKSKRTPLIQITPILSSFGWASFLMFLYAANTTILPIKDLIESKMDILLMFKASGRFSWPVYFVVAILAAKILQAWFYKLKKKNVLAYAFILPIILLYAYEVNHYNNQIFKNRNVKNYLTAPETNEISEVLRENNIDTSHYQAMALLPLFVGWNEKMRVGTYIHTEKGGLTVSALTGIPMINGRLSRNSTKKTLHAIQMASHPIIKKNALHHLPNEKPILLIQGKESDDRLTYGDKALRSIGEVVFDFGEYKGYKVKLSDIEKMQTQFKNQFLEKFKNKGDNTNKCLKRKGFENNDSPRSLFGIGAYVTKAGEEKLVDLRKKLSQPDTISFSIWNEVTMQKYGMPDFIVTVKGDDKYYYRNVITSRKQREIFKNWVRTNAFIPLVEGNNWIEIMVRGNQSFLLDELQISYQKDTIFTTINDSLFLINNLPVQY